MSWSNLLGIALVAGSLSIILGIVIAGHLVITTGIAAGITFLIWRRYDS